MFQRVMRLRRLCSLMPIGDAIRFINNEESKQTFAVQLRKLPYPIKLRGRTTDIRCFEKIFMYRDYQSPFDIKPKLIIDAGANIGLSALYFAVTYPDAVIIAIEPEIHNFQLLQRNCAQFGRIKPLHGALWSSTGSVPLTGSIDGKAWGFTIGRSDRTTVDMVPAYSVPQLLEASGFKQIDILKLDIEGSERELFLKDTTWLNHISLIAIELHDRFEPGCTRAVYQKLVERQFHQEVCGENVFIRLNTQPSHAHCADREDTSGIASWPAKMASMLTS